jgi:hypothetical protein
MGSNLQWKLEVIVNVRSNRQIGVDMLLYLKLGRDHCMLSSICGSQAA